MKKNERSDIHIYIYIYIYTYLYIRERLCSQIFHFSPFARNYGKFCKFFTSQKFQLLKYINLVDFNIKLRRYDSHNPVSQFFDSICSNRFSYIPLFYTAKSIYRVSSNKFPRRLLDLKLCGAGLIRWQHKLKGGAYFKVREMSNIKCQNLVIFSFKIRMTHKFSLSINQI